MAEIIAKFSAAGDFDVLTDSLGDIVYTVQKGDTISGIAAKYRTTYQKLAEYNGIANPNKITVSQKIKIPASSSGLAFKVGGIVEFTGSTHYTSAGAASGPSCKPGKAKVTAISANAKRPYHLIHTDSTGMVYGWVDAADIGAAASSEIAVGDVVQFAGGPHYTSANATSYKTSPKAGPAKVTAISKGAKHPYHIVHTTSASSVYGWVNADKITK